MVHFDISLLGTVQVRRDGKPVSDRAYAKVLALLAWLAVESDRPHQRAFLAALLWPDQTDERARHSLRQALSTLRRMLGDDAADALIVNRDAITFQPMDTVQVDVGVFNQLQAECDRHEHVRLDRCAPCVQRLQRAIGLYQGDFLQGFSIGDSTEFEDWVLVWRERLRQQAIAAYGSIAAWHMERGAPEEATASVRRQLALDPLDEAVHRQLMLLLMQAGKRAEALAHYERCRAILEDELGVEPEPETEALRDQLLAGEHEPVTSTPRTVRSFVASPLPAPVNGLVGRERELEELDEILAHRDCRLLTLLGPGGSGKTRLAIEVASRQERNISGVVAFVSLALVTDPSEIAPVVAEALGVSLLGSATLERQLIAWLRDREVMLVLDNAEHLTGDMRVVSTMLSSAPGLRVVATSRERLNLQGEWVFEVTGLAVPRGDATDSFEGFGSVELFRERLRQARARHPLQHEERPLVVRICQLVEGMPLALELAAAWGQTLSLDRIAEEIQRNLDFLATSMQDVPDRHRSMRAVFNHSWDQLTEEERATFLRLSVFRDGFDLPAAEAAARATAFQLAALVGKSLLVQQDNGRYQLHELLRQYGAEMLRDDPAAEASLRTCHGEYFLELLASREDALTGRDQQTALAEIEADIENVRLAWRWAIEQGEMGLVSAASHAYWLYSVIRGQMREAAGAFGMVLDAIEADGTPVDELPWPWRLAYARAMTRCGGFRSGLGQYDEAIALLERGTELLRELGQRREVGLALNMHAAACDMVGDVALARDLLEESLDEFRAVGDSWGIAFSLNDLGLMSYLLEEDVDAAWYCQQSLAMFREIGDQRGQAFAAFNLGRIAARRCDYPQAKRLYEESLSLRTGRHDRWGIAASMVQLAAVLHATGAVDDARAMLTDALGMAWDSSVTPVVLDALVELAALELDDGERERATEMLTAITAHPATPGPVRERVATLMPQARSDRPALIDAGDHATWATRAVDAYARALTG